MRVPAIGAARASLLGALLVGTAAAAQEPPKLTALRVASDIAADGFDDGRWAEAPVFDRFFEREPAEGAPSSQPTEIRIALSPKTLFIRVRMKQSVPVIARERGRDADLTGDDQVELLLDTFHDHRTAYYFATNPNGVFVDGHFNEETPETVVSFDWDGIWDVRTRRSPDGWEALFSIPLSTLAFDSRAGSAWGFNLKRTTRATNETVYVSGWQREFVGKTASHGAELRGLEGLGARRLAEAAPYVSGAIDHLSAPANTNVLGKAGADVRYGLTSKIEADLTANTDFSETEADTQQVNLTRFPLFFPEKRSFFLQRAQIFAFGTQATTLPYFSRRIGLTPDGSTFVPILAGLKMTGRVERDDFGIFAIRTRRDSGQPATDFGLVRMKHDLGGGTTVGILGVGLDRRDGDASGPRTNRAYGADARWVATPRLVFNAFFVETKTPGRSGDAQAKYLAGSYQDDSWNVDAHAFDAGRHYDTEVGFTPRTGVRNYFADVTFHPPRPLPSLRDVELEYFQNYTQNRDGSLEEREYQATFRVNWQNGAYIDSDIFDTSRENLTAPFEIHRGVVLPAGFYTLTRHQLAAGTDNSRAVYGSANFTFGPFYGGQRRYYSGEVHVKPWPGLALGVAEQYNVIRLPEGNFDLSLLGVRIDWQPSVRLFGSIFVQANTDAQINTINARLRWIVRPGTDLYLVYDQRTGAGLERADRRVSVKFVRTFDL